MQFWVLLLLREVLRGQGVSDRRWLFFLWVRGEVLVRWVTALSVFWVQVTMVSGSLALCGIAKIWFPLLCSFECAGEFLYHSGKW